MRVQGEDHAREPEGDRHHHDQRLEQRVEGQGQDHVQQPAHDDADLDRPRSERPLPLGLLDRDVVARPRLADRREHGLDRLADLSGGRRLGVEQGVDLEDPQQILVLDPAHGLDPLPLAHGAQRDRDAAGGHDRDPAQRGHLGRQILLEVGEDRHLLPRHPDPIEVGTGHVLAQLPGHRLGGEPVGEHRTVVDPEAPGLLQALRIDERVVHPLDLDQGPLDPGLDGVEVEPVGAADVDLHHVPARLLVVDHEHRLALARGLERLQHGAHPGLDRLEVRLGLGEGSVGDRLEQREAEPPEAPPPHRASPHGGLDVAHVFAREGRLQRGHRVPSLRQRGRLGQLDVDPDAVADALAVDERHVIGQQHARGHEQADEQGHGQVAPPERQPQRRPVAPSGPGDRRELARAVVGGHEVRQVVRQDEEALDQAEGQQGEHHDRQHRERPRVAVRHQQDRQEGHRGRQHHAQHGPGHVAGGVDRRLPRRLALREPGGERLGDDDRVVDQDPQHEDQREQGDQVERLAHGVEHQDAAQVAERQPDRGHRRDPPAEEDKQDPQHDPEAGERVALEDPQLVRDQL